MIVKRKTRKAIRKSVKKVIKKHGPKVVAGLAGSIASTLATLASTEAPGRNGKKSNLSVLSRKVSDAFTGEDSSETRKKGRASKDNNKTPKRRKARRQETEKGEASI